MEAAVGDVEGLAPGAYRYEPARHELHRLAEEDRRDWIEANTIDGSPWLHEAPLVLVIAGATAAATAEFDHQPPRGRGSRYVQIEAGHASQSIALQATALGLGAVFVGGFDDDALHAALGTGSDHDVLGLLAVGEPAR